MIAEIINGILEITPKNQTESYALDKWWEQNVSCSRQADARNLSFYPYRKIKRSLWNRFRLWMHNRIIKMYNDCDV
jgi:hypothetical protein